jgi:hypothetical protein
LGEAPLSYDNFAKQYIDNKDAAIEVNGFQYAEDVEEKYTKYVDAIYDEMNCNVDLLSTEISDISDIVQRDAEKILLSQ